MTLLKRQQTYYVEGEPVCHSCAAAELSRLLRAMEVRVSKRVRGNLEVMLRRLRSVDKVASFLSSKFRPSQNPAITLYDQIQATTEDVRRTPLEGIPIPPEFAQVLRRHGITSLLPIQTKALEAGLMEGENLLVVSGTTSGKSLVGELAGVTAALKGKTYIYLSPLVALANQKYHEYRERYGPLGLRVAIRVGMSSIDVGDDALVVVDDEVEGANIIVASYEGFDFLLRSGIGKRIGDVGVVVIDEIQMVADPDRGPEVDGLLARLRTLYPKAQIVALSATVGNPEELAYELRLKPVIMRGRPVPLQRHLILVISELDKIRMIADLARDEYQKKSSFGYRGQTIVFTNSRRNTHVIATELKRRGISARAYHAGMTYYQRRQVEESFAAGKIAAVVTTAALAAGVDFPASTVIFESLLMGNKMLSVAEFTQMLGRAGRLGKHDMGKAVILAEIGRRYFGEEPKTEEEAALDLLNNPLEEVQPEATYEQSIDQLLATLSCFNSITRDRLKRAYQRLLSRTVSFDEALRFLKQHKLAEQHGNYISATELGRAAAISYFSASNVAAIQQYPYDDAEELSIMFHPLTNVYLSPRLQAEIEHSLRTHFATRLFSGPVLDLMSARSRRAIKKLPRWVLQTFSKWNLKFFNCRCKESPFCDHGMWTLSRMVLDLRYQGLTPSQISSHFLKQYELFIYPGDCFDFLEQQVHVLEGIRRIAETLGRYELADSAERTIARIERPQEADNFE